MGDEDSSSSSTSSSSSSPPSYTTPTVNPRDEQDLGRSLRPKFQFAQNPMLEPTRVHPDATRHPLTGRMTKPLQNRSK